MYPSKELKIAHIADCHLRNAQYGSSARGARFLDGIKSAIDAAKAEGADLILCSGDLLDSNNPGPAVINWQLADLHGYLHDKEISMIVSVGNHDNCTPSWLTPYEHTDDVEFLEPGLHLLRDFAITYQPDWCPFGLNILSIDYCDKFEFLRKSDPAMHHNFQQDIIMWHGEIKEFCGFPKEDAIEINEIPQGICKLLAMGHIHVHKSTQRSSDGMVIAYPGSTEMLSEDEDENKYLYLYTFKSNGKGGSELTSIESVPFKTQPVIRRTVRTDNELQEVVERIKEDPDVLAYIRYDKSLHDAVPRLHEVADENKTVLRLTPLMPDRFNVHTMSREAVVRGPAAFFEENAADLIHDEETRLRVSSLCTQLLTPGNDRRESINKFCDARLGTTSL